MPVKPINQLPARTPAAADVFAVADPLNGQTGKATSTQIVNAGLPTKTGNANKALVVNSGATGVEWKAILPSYNPATDGGKTLKIKSDGSGLEWV